MSASATDIVRYLEDLLRPDSFADLGPNGLQVPGVEDVATIVTGVSGQLELFERAAEQGAELVLVHHGILWDFQPRRVSPAQARRLRVLLEHEINLVAFHLPLDAHPDVGNNALIAQALGCARREPWGAYRGSAIGVAGRFPDGGVPAAELFARVEELTGRRPLVFDAGPDPVQTIGVISGAAASSLADAAHRGLDAFLTGEPAEHVMADAREAGIHFIAAGHYATETFGVRLLGDLLAERFDVVHRFVDIPNPI